MTQDPFAAAWDGGGTATADPFAAAWDKASPKRTPLDIGRENQAKAKALGIRSSDPEAFAEDLGIVSKQTRNEPVPDTGGLLDAVKQVPREMGNLAGEAINAVPDLLALPSKLAGATGQFVGRKLGSKSIEQGSTDFLKTVDEATPRIPTDPNSPATRIGGGLGFMATAVAAPEAIGLKGFQALVPGAVMMGAQNGVALHQKVLAETGDPVRAMAALLGGAGAGTGLGLLPVARLFARLNAESGGALVRGIGDLAVGGAYGAGQSTINDTLQEHLTGQDLPIVQNAIKEGGFGALTQVIAGAAGSALGNPTDSAGKPPAATAEPSVPESPDTSIPNEQTSAPVEQFGKAEELATAPPEGGVGVSEAVPGEQGAESKAGAEAVDAPSIQDRPAPSEAIQTPSTESEPVPRGTLTEGAEFKPPLPLRKAVQEAKPEIPIERAAPEEKPPIPVEKAEKPQIPLRKKGDALGLLKTNPLELLGIGGGKIGGKVEGTMHSPDEGFYPSPETKAEAVIRKVADRFGTARRVEREAPGKGSDFSGSETRMHGRAAVAQRALERDQQRAVDIMKRAGISAQDMADYATARHAETRNKIIAKRTEGEVTEGSGMSAKRAAEVLAKAKPEAAEVMKIHDRLRDKSLAFAVESGLVSQETADAWKREFGSTFASLKTIGAEEPRSMPGVSKSLQVKGPEAKRAEGRETEATNPFVSMFQNAQDVILRGEKNIVAQEFGKLVENNPGPWAEFVEPEGPHAPSGEDVFTYKEGGEPKYIRVHDKSTLKALKNLDPTMAGTTLQWIGKASRVMSSLATSRNPRFLLTNLVRDVQTALSNVSAEESLKTAKRIAKDVLPSTKEIFAALHSPEKASPYAKEYLEHGALTDWIEPTTPQKRLAKMESRLAETLLRTKMRAVVDTLEAMSNSVENGARFAYFKALREAGISADVAAVKSKELTVNWSKKGEWGATMNALYLFSSANANGTLRFGQALARNPGRAAAVAGSFYAAGYALALLNESAGEDKKDGQLWWDKQSEANKQRNFVIQHANGTTTRIPLPPGWGWFVYAGVETRRMQREGSIDPSNLLTSAAGEISPIRAGSLGQLVTPWFLDPFVAVSENKDYKGDAIFQRDDHDKRPYSSLPNASRASETSRTISKVANDLTGGDEGRQGRVDVPPIALDYIAGESASGVGKFMQQVGKFASNTLHGETTPFRDIPFVSAFAGDAPQTYARDFSKIVARIEVENTAQKADKPYNSDVLEWKKTAAKYQRAIAAARADGDDESANDLAAEFIREFNSATKPKKKK